MAYSDPEIKADLAYWHRETPGSQAEIDYLVQCNDQVIPIEVKSGITGGLKSLVHYIQTKHNIRHGIHFSSRSYSPGPLYDSVPLYLISKLTELARGD